MKRVVAVLLVLGVALVGGAGWFYSGLVIEPSRGNSYPLEVTAVSKGRVTLKGGTDTDAPGTYGLTWADGNATLGPVISVDAGTVTRSVVARKGKLRPGVRAYLDRWMWGHEDPSVPFSRVSIKGFPAWRTAGKSTTWVIAVHGRNANASEALRVLPTFHKLGIPVLGISYRNDEDAPASSDGVFHLGATEWEDVASAITYAKSEGARDIILYGYSMGGGIVPMAARKLPGEPIKGLILDSPVMDWTAPIELGAKQQGVPVWLASVAKFVIERRTGLSFDEINHVRHAAEFKVPILLFVDDDDASVPIGPSLEFARKRLDLVTLFRTKGAGHVGSWNADPARYEQALRDFVSDL